MAITSIKYFLKFCFLTIYICYSCLSNSISAVMSLPFITLNIGNMFSFIQERRECVWSMLFNTCLDLDLPKAIKYIIQSILKQKKVIIGIFMLLLLKVFKLYSIRTFNSTTCFSIDYYCRPQATHAFLTQ